MVRVISGTDVYGAVRKVDKTPIVTKFAMLQLIPVFPIESYYLARLGPQSFSGIPIIRWQTSQAIFGLRLARVDRLSAAMAYVRGIGGTLAVVGFIGLMVAVVSSFNGPKNPKDPLQRYLLPVSGVVLLTGALIAIPTYYFTYAVPQREASIRHRCGQVLGIAADPAHVDLETARELIRMAREALAESGITEPNKVVRKPELTDPFQKRALLALARGMLAINSRADELEPLADTLLDQINSESSEPD